MIRPGTPPSTTGSASATCWAIGYTLLKLPLGFGQYLALAFWACGLADLACPLWWPVSRNHPPGTTLSPVPAATPPPFGSFVHATSWGGTLLVAIFGAALLLIAPWLTRGVVTADRWLARSLLGPGTLTQRVRDLEQARARVVDDSVALLRQVERDLHDGAQVRLAAGSAIRCGSPPTSRSGRRRPSRRSPDSARPNCWPTRPSTAAQIATCSR